MFIRLIIYIILKTFGVSAINLQKKWKSLRDSFNRELKILKKVETGKGASKRKKYIYFDQLLFLEPLAQQRQTTSNLETGNDQENLDNADETRIEGSPSSNNTKRKKKKCDKEDELINILQKRIVTNEEQNKDKNISQDDDTLFCLSLVSDFKKILDDMKTDAKCEVLQVLNKYKRLSTSVSGYSTQNVPNTNLGLSSQNVPYNSIGQSCQNVPYTNLGHSSRNVPYNVLGKSSANVPYNNKSNNCDPIGASHVPTSEIFQLQQQSIFQMPKPLAPREPDCSTSTVAHPPRCSQAQTNIDIPFRSPTYSVVSSPDSPNTYSEQGYEDRSQTDSEYTEDAEDSIITQLF